MGHLRWAGRAVGVGIVDFVWECGPSVYLG